MVTFKPIAYLIVFCICVSTITAHAAKINLNTTGAAALVHLIKGIGEKRAQAIIAYRQNHGPFHSVLDIAAVRGIGQNFVMKNKHAIEEKLSVE